MPRVSIGGPLAALLLLAAQAPAECPDATSCRQVALEAAAQQEFERFHDLAWRALQRARRNDPELMLLLARAQSLSGRPGDALVMLRRLADTGLADDALTSDDFRRVRALPGWPELEARILAAREKRALEPARPSPPPAAAQGPAPAVAPDPPIARGKITSRKNLSKPAPDRTPEPERMAEPDRTPEPARTPDPAAVIRAAPKVSGEEAVSLPGAIADPVGLAYDRVSRRFVVGDGRRNKVIVADEVFKHVNDLIGPDSGGFGSLTALEIDGSRGDLWITSATAGGTPSLHKLQLVSGRVLARIELPDGWAPASLTDLSISEAGLLLLDGAGSRLLVLDPSSGQFSRTLPLDVSSPASVTSTGAVAYVAHAGGVAWVDLRSGRVEDVRGTRSLTLTGLQRIRWHQGGLVAIQDVEQGQPGRLVRIRLGRSQKTAVRLDVLANGAGPEGSALAIANGRAYYLARAGQGMAIRVVDLRRE